MTRRTATAFPALATAALLLSLSAGLATAQALNGSGINDCVIEPRSVIKLGSADEGVIEAIAVDRGDLVRKGQVVARLESEIEILALEAARMRANRDVELRSGRARLSYRAGEAKRAQELFRKKIVSTKVRDEAAIEKKLAQYGVKAAELDNGMAKIELKNAEMRLARRTIHSPVDGIVVERAMAPGEYAHEQATVMTIAQVDPLHVEVFVPIADYGRIAVGNEAKVMPEAPVGGTYTARVTVVDRVFDTASGTFGVRLELPNPALKLPAGLKCRVRFSLGER